MGWRLLDAQHRHCLWRGLRSGLLRRAGAALQDLTFQSGADHAALDSRLGGGGAVLGSDIQPYALDAGAAHAEDLGRAVGDIDDAAIDNRTAIVDAKDDGASVAQIRNPDVGT